MVKEVTKIFTNLVAWKIKIPKTQQVYVNAINRRYNLDGEGRKNSREKHKLGARRCESGSQ